MAVEELREDIAAARKQMRVKLGGGREIKKLLDHLWEGEVVHRMTTGTYGSGTGLLVLTDRRLLFVKDGIMSKTTEDFPLSKVSSIQWSSGMTMGTVVVFASGNKAEIKNVQKDDGKAIVDLIRSRLTEGLPSTSAPSTEAGASDVDQLVRLAELHGRGVLSDQEFAAAKAKVLGI